MNQQKSDFLRHDFLPHIKTIREETTPRWGKMNAQQMVEHVTNFFKVSTADILFPLTTPPEHLPKYREFLMSEKEFRENTKAPVLPDEPLPLVWPDMPAAISKLEESVQQFFNFFEKDPLKKTLHPAFGELNFAEWVQLHHKHVKHHLKQFGVEIPAFSDDTKK